MKNTKASTRTCPLCGETYTAVPALSRTDNCTLICPDCGTRQALTEMGIDTEQQKQILSLIHRSSDFK